jgi:hypothetical protein
MCKVIIAAIVVVGRGDVRASFGLPACGSTSIATAAI